MYVCINISSTKNTYASNTKVFLTTFCVLFALFNLKYFLLPTTMTLTFQGKMAEMLVLPTVGKQISYVPFLPKYYKKSNFFLNHQFRPNSQSIPILRYFVLALSFLFKQLVIEQETEKI